MERYYIAVFKIDEDENYNYIGLYKTYTKRYHGKVINIWTGDFKLDNIDSVTYANCMTFFSEIEASNKIRLLRDITKNYLKKDYFKKNLPIYKFILIKMKEVF